ncbi:MAG: nitrilase-related carbon-nitrogen hydrolase [Chloroflexota bacterium]
MDRLITACVQQRMRLPNSIDDYVGDLRRFMRIAEKKNARLIIFPELAGIMIAPTLLQDFRSSLLKRSDQSRRASASFWEKLSGPIYNGAAALLRANFRNSVEALLEVAPDQLLDTYVDVFAGLAKEFGVTIVAPSCYLPDRLTKNIHNMAGVFGPNGEELGFQAKVMVHPSSDELGQPGESWEVVPTEVGRLGVILGSDVLYPEVGRLLAYQKADVLISQAACVEPVQYNKVRSGMLARMQDNQLFGVSSFLVGPNELLGDRRSPFVGRSAVFAPQELTLRLNGIMVEMGNQRSEGVITAEWDFAELRELWHSSETPIRQLPTDEKIQPLLGQLYERLQNLPFYRSQDELLELPEQSSFNGSTLEAVTLTLDELPVVSSISSRWPLPELPDLSDLPFEQTIDDTDLQTLVSQNTLIIGADDETEELDALNDHGGK